MQTVRATWVYDPTSTLVPEVPPTTVAPAVGGGNWIRLPEADPSWLYASNWYINATTGSDENVGQTALAPLRTHGELERRWGGGILRPPIAFLTIRLCTVNIQTSLPTSDPVFPTCVIGPAAVLWYRGQVETVLYSGTFTGVVAVNPATDQPQHLTDAAIGNWTPYLFKRWRITTAGARFNTIGWVARDLAAQTCRSSQPQLPGNMNLANSALWPIAVGGAVQVPQVGDTFNIENLVAITLGPIETTITEGGSLSASDGKLVFGELAVRPNPIGLTVNMSSTGSSGIAPYSCELPRLIVQNTNFANFSNNRYYDFLQVAGGGSIAFNAGLADGGTQGIGVEIFPTGLALFGQNFMCQNVGVRGTNIVAQQLCVFDSAVTGNNPGGHGLAIGRFRTTVTSTTNQVSWANVDTLWGTGNGGTGLFINGGSVVNYTNGGVARLRITGAGGDFRLNNNAIANVWDQTANAGAGAWLAPRATTWVNLAATVATTGFGGNATDVPTGTRILQAAA